MTGKNQKAPDQRLEDLARRLMDLWQDQMTAVATNPDLASQAARLMAALPQMGASLPGMWPAVMNPVMNPAMGQGAGVNPMGLNPGAMNPADFAAAWWKGMHGFANAATNAPGPAEAPRDDKPRAEKTGPAPAAPASGAGDVGLAELRGRLAELEGKLAELDGKSGKPPKKSSAGKRRPAARRTRAPARPGEAGGTGGGTPS